MKQTYQEAIDQVFKDEGGYTNDAGDPGGPTNWGITIIDARKYWKPNATASDVKQMPKSVAEDIYIKHYATPINYDQLPPGLDYTLLDYAINSGSSRALKAYVREQAVTKDIPSLINLIYNERTAFLRSLHTWPIFGKGWTNRLTHGRLFALRLYDKYHPIQIKGTQHMDFTQIMILAGGAVVGALGFWLGRRGLSGVITDVENLKLEVNGIKTALTPPAPAVHASTATT
jgi:lysozyme family protein